MGMIPEENLEIFRLLYMMETGLRELIIDELSAVGGDLWYKTYLPGDILEKYRAGRQAEQRSSWTRCIPHHPIYYIDFPDLRKVIESDRNWRAAFGKIFRRKEVLSATLTELEPIRNKIAHNRKATDEDVRIAQGAFAKISTAVGRERFTVLSSRCTLAMDIISRLTHLERELSASVHVCLGLGPLSTLSSWESVRGKWWLDETFLGSPIDGIVKSFRLLEDYSSMPRTRGSGHKIELWVKNCGLARIYSTAEKEFQTLLAAKE